MSQTANDRHPDIEIYVKQRTVEQLQTWLNSVFDQLEFIKKQGQTFHYNASLNGQQISITLIDRAAKEFSSIWFDSDQTPWPCDLDCAEQAQQQLDSEVRCIASGWTEGDEPDEWWAVTGEGKNKILWRN